VIEDSPAGVEAALAAGMAVVRERIEAAAARHQREADSSGPSGLNGPSGAR